MHLLEKLERKIPSVIFQLLMSKAYAKATTFRTNFDFMNSPEKFRIYGDKTGNFYILVHAVR